MDELGPDEKPWLDALRSADEPSPVDRARVRAAVTASVAAGAAGACAAALGKTGAAAKAAKVGFFAGAAWKVGLAAVVVSMAGGAVVMTRVHRANGAVTRAATTATNASFGGSPVPPVAAKAEAAAAGEVPVEPSAVAAPIAPAGPKGDEAAPGVGSAGKHAARPPRAAASGADDLDGELQLLTQAQRALERGDPAAALAALAQHRREHPQGALSIERDGLRAVASCEAKHSDGRAMAERFVARNPTSPLVARVRAACSSP